MKTVENKPYREICRKELTVSKTFLDYDTDYGKYKLPAKGKYLILIFLKPGINTNLFTTIRRFTPEKYKYYKDARGEMFEVQIPVLQDFEDERLRN
jgi:hypothetical protein